MDTDRLAKIPDNLLIFSHLPKNRVSRVAVDYFLPRVQRDIKYSSTQFGQIAIVSFANIKKLHY